MPGMLETIFLAFGAQIQLSSVRPRVLRELYKASHFVAGVLRSHQTANLQ